MKKPLKNKTKKQKEDYALLCEAKKGNQKAFTTLLQKYKEPIYFTMLEKTGNKLEAEEITFEAFFKAFINLHKYSKNYSFKAWLFKIAENTFIDFIRKKKKDTISLENIKNNVDSVKLLQVDEPNGNTEKLMLDKQKMDKMKCEVEKLKKKYKDLIKLRYFQGYTYKEIAEEMDFPIGTVKTQLYRAKKILTRNMQRSASD